MSFPLRLRNAALLKSKCYVDGRWLGAASSKEFAVEDPASLTEIVKCPEFNEADTTAAVDCASQAFKEFRKTPARARSKLLRRWYDLIVENAEDLARIITAENGKPLADARTEVNYAASFIEWFSEEAPRIYGDTIHATNPSNRIVTLKEPVGVCALIAPWNFPAAMITRKAGPALAAGCTVVVKAPAEAPLTALALAELAHQAGIPKGVVNVITALKNTVAVGQVLTSHPSIKKVSFTGSTAVGKILMRQSASTLKKLSLELGGNAPFIIFEDADLEAAVQGLVASKFRISGQTCVCANRILVHQDIHDEFVERLLAVVKGFKVGNGFDPSTTHGPLIHERAVHKVEQHVRNAISSGAQLVHGGRRSDAGSNFFTPTILTNMQPGMQICDEETFGPIAAIFAFKSEQEAIDLANDTDVGLGGYFFSKDASRCWRVAEALEVGMVGVNTGQCMPLCRCPRLATMPGGASDPLFDKDADWLISGAISDTAAPFGGVKQSGFGREGSKYGIDEFVVTKMVMTGLATS